MVSSNDVDFFLLVCTRRQNGDSRGSRAIDGPFELFSTDALMGPTISSPTLMKKASASELHLQKLLDKQKRKQKRRKLKADLRRALAGVEKAANKARIAANRVLKKN